MKKIAVCVGAMLLVSVLLSCGSTNVEKRSITMKAEHMNSLSKAKKIAENWDFECVYEGTFNNKDNMHLYVARAPGSKDGVVFFEVKNTDVNYYFRYVCTAGQATSCYVVKQVEGIYLLDNTDKEVRMESGVYSGFKEPEKVFKLTIGMRDNLKKSIKALYKYNCIEPICAEQIAAGAIQLN